MRTRTTLGGATCLIALVVVLAGWQRSDPDTPFHPRPPRISPGTIDARATLRPDSIASASIGSYELGITIGSGGLPARGGILVAFPKAWFAHPFPLPKRLQSNDSSKPHFLSVKSTRPGATFTVTVDTTGFSGKIERFNQTIGIVTGAPLQQGDVVSVILANTNAPYIAGADTVRVAIDREGAGRFVEISDPAKYAVTPAAVEDFTLLGPTEAAVGQPVQLQIAAFDRFWNVAERFSGRVRVTAVDHDRTVSMHPSDRGIAHVSWTPMKEGFYFPQAFVSTAGRAQPVLVRGNPIRVFAREPPVKTYWGELHSHSSISADGLGNDPFSYARDPARLDFFAATEHADDDGSPRANAIRPEDWAVIKERVRQFNAPGRFVTLLAYECSFNAPSGHHNVFFRGVDGEPWPADLMGSVTNLWAKIRAGDAITIPHHMGILFGAATVEQQAAGPGLQPIVTTAGQVGARLGNSVDWTIHDPVRRPLLEMYSLHGTSEFYDPSDPLAYENARFTGARSVPGAHYARDAWAAGLELGVVAATDNHSSQPGQPQGGVAAVRAPMLTREAIFDALAGKHTYATTGQRIYMDLTIAGVPMGGAGRARGPVSGSVTIAAPSDIATVEIVRLSDSTKSFAVAAHWENAGRLLQTTFTDSPEGTRVMYYLRMQLKEQVRGRDVRGWSSPIWLDLDRP